MVEESRVNSIRKEIEDRHDNEDHPFSFFDQDQHIYDEVIDIVENKGYDLSTKEVNDILERL